MKNPNQFNTILRGRHIIILTISLLLILVGCDNRTKLERTIRKELATEVRNDSLFLGIRFGMERQEFYDHCWELNRNGIVKEGMGNMSVEYLFKDSLDQPVAFNFYPEFKGKTISIYKTTFYYYAWAPWHKHFQSDQMLKMLSPILLDWYGGNELFSQVVDGKLHVYKIDGNRMIDMYIISEREVAAIYSDLSKTYSNN